MTQLRYQLTSNQVSIAEMQKEVDKLWKQLQDPSSEFSVIAKQRGIEIESLRDYSRNEIIQLKPSGKGLDPWVVELIVTLTATVGANIVYDIWKELILPQLKHKFGEGSIEKINRD